MWRLGKLHPKISKALKRVLKELTQLQLRGDACVQQHRFVDEHENTRHDV
jgi:hypothetical protein